MVNVPLIEFGDGCHAYYHDERGPYLNEEGYKVIRILLSPTEYTQGKYNITEAQLDKEGSGGMKAMAMEYKVDGVIWKNRSEGGKVLAVLWNFDGSVSEFMRYINGGLIELCNSLRKELSIAKLRVSKLEMEREHIFTHPTEYIKGIKDMSMLASKNADSTMEDEQNE